MTNRGFLNGSVTTFEETPRRHTRSVMSVAFSPDGLLLVSGSDDGTAKVWKVLTGDLVATLVYGADTTGAVKSVRPMHFPHLKQSVTILDNQTVGFFDPDSQEKFSTYLRSPWIRSYFELH